MNETELSDNQMDHLVRMALECGTCNIVRNRSGVAKLITFTSSAMAEKGTWIRGDDVWKRVS